MFDENLENIVDQFENQILPVRDGDTIELIEEKFGFVKHPQIGYRIGEKYLIIDWKEDALPYLIESASYGLDPMNPYLTTGYADSIAQSMWYILKNFNFQEDFEPYEYKIYCSSYMILSLVINSMGTNAFNSLKTRAMLIDNLNSTSIKKMLSKYYYSGEDLCKEILSYPDYYLASTGFSNAGQNQNAQNAARWAQENKEVIMSLPNYKGMLAMTDQSFLKMCQENQISLLNNMLEDFKNGSFQLSKPEFENAIENYRIKPRKGFSSWI